MSTYVLFGKYTPESLRGISAKRTEEADKLIKGLGGEIRAGYALLGDTDLLFVVELPDNETAMKASASLTKLTGIGFRTAPAVTIEEFDRLLSS
ncbi:MAG: hypothetical protein OHK0044_24230 [Burkholderiaceae bacterium]